MVSVAAVVVSADPPGPSAGDDTAKPSVPRGDVAIPPGTEDEPAGGAGSGNPVYSDLTANALLSGPVRTVDGKPALRYSFTRSGQFVQQWWVERIGGSFRVEFFARASDERAAGQLAARIVETFTIG